MARAIAFYTDVLGMTAQSFQPADGTTRWALLFGAQKINLHLAGASFVPHAARPEIGSADLCFLTDTPVEQWITHFATKDVALVEGPVKRSGAAQPLISVYIRDPDGALIEISNQI